MSNKAKKHPLEDIHHGRTPKCSKKWWMPEAPYPNCGAYDNWRVFETHRDNNGQCYNGSGYPQGSSIIRVPSIKRSVKIWKNFYKMFPKYQKILKECLAGERKCSISNGTVAVEIPNTTHRTIMEDGMLFNEPIIRYRTNFPNEVHNNMVKLKIIESIL